MTLRDEALKRLQSRYETDGARMAAYEGFILGEHVATFKDWNAKIHNLETGEMEPVPAPPMPW